MNRIRLLVIGTALMFALSTVAQQTATSPDTHAAGTSAALAPVEQHLRMLSEKLDLTEDQQARARPILQEMHDGSQKLADDQSLTPEQRQAGMHPLIIKADKQIREFLTEDQKKKLDDLEVNWHQRPYGKMDGNPSTSPQG
jgi:Spy/CpxP family protein refolding chaperone